MMQPGLPMAIGILLALAGCGTTGSTSEPRADAPALADEGDGWDMKAYQFVTLTRAAQTAELDSAAKSEVMRGHLAHLDSLYDAGIIRLVGPFGDDRDVRGFALLDVPDSATAMAHMAVDPSVQAGIFTLDSRPWWGPSSLDVSAAAPSPAP